MSKPIIFRRFCAWFIITALMLSFVPMRFQTVAASGGELLFSFPRSATGVNQNVRTLTTYTETRNWAYAADTVTNTNNPVMQLATNLLLKTALGEWVALKLQIPETGVFDVELTYQKQLYAATMDVYIIPAPLGATPEDIEAALTQAEPIGRVEGYGATSTHIATLNGVAIDGEREYLAVFVAAEKNARAYATNLYPISLTLKPNATATLSSSEVDVSKTELLVGDNVLLKTNLRLANGAYISGQAPDIRIAGETARITMQSSDISVATIRENGWLRAISPGTTEITAQVVLGDVSLETTITITVLKITLTDIQVKLDKPVLYMTQQAGLEIVLLDENGNEFFVDSAVITVASLDTDRIVVGGKSVFARAAGQALIRVAATFDGVRKQVDFPVEVLPIELEQVELSSDTAYLTPASHGAQLNISLRSNLDTEIDPRAANIIYTSLTPQFATVDAQGLVKPVATGDAVIVAEVTLGEHQFIREITLPVLSEGMHYDNYFPRKPGGANIDLRTLSMYGNRNWAYAADTVTSTNYPVMQLIENLQLKTAVGEWVALKLRIYHPGVYVPEFTYLNNTYASVGEVFFFRAGEDLSTAAIEAELAVHTPLATIDMYGSKSVKKATLPTIQIDKSGEFLLVFRAKEQTDRATATTFYPIGFTLDSSGALRLKSVSSRLEKPVLTAGEQTSIIGTATLSNGKSMPFTTAETELGQECIVFYKSKDPSVAMVDSEGRITAFSSGVAQIDTIITVEGNKLVTSSTVTVSQSVFDQLLVKIPDELYLSERIMPEIELILDDGMVFKGEGAEIRLLSNNPDRVAVMGNTLTALAVGESEITVQARLGSIMKIIVVPVVVKPEYFSAVEVLSEYWYVKQDGHGTQLSVQLMTNLGNVLDADGAEVVYTSQTPELATVDANGFVTPHAIGTAVILAEVTYGSRTVSAHAEIGIKTGKVARTYYTEEKVAAARENIIKYDWAEKLRDNAVREADKYVDQVDLLWEMVVGEGIPRAMSIGGFRDPKQYYCRYCNVNLLAKHGNYSWITNPIANPWKIQCPDCKRRFPSNDFGSLYKLGLNESGIYDRELAKTRNAENVAQGGRDAFHNDLYPENGEGWGADDGWGYYVGHTYSTVEPEVHAYIPVYMHLGMWDSRSSQQAFYPKALSALGDAYLYTGNAKYGRAGAIMIDRFADIYPDLELLQYYITYANSHGGSFGGKAIGRIWEAQRVAPMLAIAYDAFYPAMEDPYVISFLSQKAQELGLENDKSTAEKIRANGEDGILRAIAEGCKTANVAGNFGMHQKAMALAAVILDDMPDTGEWIEWIFREGVETTQNLAGGDVYHTLVNRISRDGFGNEASPSYNNIWLNDLLGAAEVLADYKSEQSVNLFENPKFNKMFYAPFGLNMLSRGAPTIGDTGATALSASSIPRDSILSGFLRLGTKELAQVLYYLNGNKSDGLRGAIFTKDPEDVATRVQNIVDTHGTYDFTRSTFYPAYGFSALRSGGLYESAGKTLDNQRDFWMYYGRTNGHGHSDTLNLGIDAFGLNFSPDLGYPQEATTHPNRMQWVRNTISHNTVVVNELHQERIEYNATPLHFDDSGRVKLMDVDAANVYPESVDAYRRTVVMVEVNDDVSYGVDFFRVKGGNHHLYSFHAQSDEIHETEGLTLHPQVDEHGQYIGSYAGPNIPWGSKDYKLLTGYSWLYDVRKSEAVPSGRFTVDFKIKDFRNYLHSRRNLHLRMTMLSPDPLSEVTIASGNPPNSASNAMIPKLEYVLAIREGYALDSLFTTVYEPYDTTRYVEELNSVPMIPIEGVPSKDDAARAVKVTHKDGRVDYVIYATNSSITYRIDDSFNFSGFIGVCTWKDDRQVFSYLNDGTSLGDLTSDIRAVTGTIYDFSRDFVFDNTITINTEQQLNPERLVGANIYVENDNEQNAVYPIESVEQSGANRITLHIGNNTVIRRYSDAQDLTSGFIYNIAKGQRYRIPLAAMDDPSPIFERISEQTVDANSEIRTGVRAMSPSGHTLNYSAANLPRGASFQPETAMFSWRPDAGQVGIHHIPIEASDGVLASTMYLRINVLSSTRAASPESVKKPEPVRETEEKPKDPSGTEASTPPAFIDLAGYNWAEDAITRLAGLGIITGRSGNVFAPGENITRADFTILLVRALQLEGTPDESFSDVPDTAYYANEVSVAKTAGIVTGVGNNQFLPNSEISREDMILMLTRALRNSGYELAAGTGALDKFKDSDAVAEYAREAAEELVQSELIVGANGYLHPKNNATRAEVAVLLKRFLDRYPQKQP